MAHMRQSRPDSLIRQSMPHSSLVFEVKVLQIFSVALSLLDNVQPRGSGTFKLCLNESYVKLKLNQNFSGNKVDYTACSLLVTLKKSCSRLHCQKGFNLIHFSY